MPLIKKKINKDLLVDFATTSNEIYYWTKEVNSTNRKYNCHIFSFEIKDEVCLSNEWEGIVATLASDFQADLDSKIERWNVYVVFVLANEIISDLKYKIEQDKYSSRKLVLDGQNINSEGDLIQVIETKLFQIPLINHAKQQSTDSIEALLKADDSELLKSLKGIKINSLIKKHYDEYLKLKA